MTRSDADLGAGPPLDPRVRDYPVLRLWEEDEDARMVFRPIPPGRFRMGSRGFSDREEPAHWVRVPPPRKRDGSPEVQLPAFWLADAPVTQAQFARWTATSDYRTWLAENAERLHLEGEHANHFSGKPTHPAESLSWWEALRFCEWLGDEAAEELGRQAGLPRGWKMRVTLPAEAHWEHACRVESETEYFSGDGEAALRTVGWFGEEWGEGGTHPVRELEPNRWGLYDMHGNVWEWCLDAWDEHAYRGRLDGADAVVPEETSNDASPSNRVLRGGSWLHSAGWCRSAVRNGWWPDIRNRNFGFRVCLLPGPGDEPGGAHTGAEERAGARRRGGTPSRSATASDGAADDGALEHLTLPERPL